MKPGCFSSRLSQMGSRSFNVGSRHSRDHFCHMNTSSREEKRPVLYFLKFAVIAKCVPDLLRVIFFPLRSSQPELPETNYRRILKHIKKDIFNNIIYSIIYSTTLPKGIQWLAAFLTNSLEHLIIRLIVIN